LGRRRIVLATERAHALLLAKIAMSEVALFDRSRRRTNPSGIRG